MSMPLRSKRTKEIEEQLAHVRWLKLQNERAIQASLQNTKMMEQNDKIVEISTNHASERSSWVNSVIKTELAKPLVLTDEDIYKIYEEDARQRRLNEDVYLRQDIAARSIVQNLSGKMEFNESTRFSLEKNFEAITRMQKECDEKFRKQVEYNHSPFTRREAIKIESKKGFSKQVAKNKPNGSAISRY